jgi:hypothetical protein
MTRIRSELTGTDSAGAGATDAMDASRIMFSLSTEKVAMQKH